MDVIREVTADSTEHGRIPESVVKSWMSSQDPDVLGATYVLLTSSIHAHRIDPPLTFDEIFEFLLRYYEWCLRTDPKSQWANSRYSAGWDLAGWFISLWDRHVDEKYIDRSKDLLERLYRTEGPELQRCIEHAILEHLFERKEIRKIFDAWRNDPGLKPAYDEAALWVAHGGTSPLS